LRGWVTIREGIPSLATTLVTLLWIAINYVVTAGIAARNGDHVRALGSRTERGGALPIEANELSVNVHAEAAVCRCCFVRRMVSGETRCCVGSSRIRAAVVARFARDAIVSKQSGSTFVPLP